MIPSPFLAERNAQAWWVSAPTITDRLLGPFAARNEARAAARALNKKYKRDILRQAEGMAMKAEFASET
jgi:hypothetical protein